MPYKAVYSADLATEKIRLKFLRAKYDRNRCDFYNSVNVYYINEEKTKFRCRNCLRTFSLTSHTYLENTKLDLRFWYEVIWSFVIGHSAHKAHKLLGTKRHHKILRSYQTIRKALLDFSQSSWKKDKGIYETDETQVYLELIDDFSPDASEPIIKEVIEEGSEIFSDTWTGYNGLAELGYLHSRVFHGDEE